MELFDVRKQLLGTGSVSKKIVSCCIRKQSHSVLEKIVKKRLPTLILLLFLFLYPYTIFEYSIPFPLAPQISSAQSVHMVSRTADLHLVFSLHFLPLR